VDKLKKCFSETLESWLGNNQSRQEIELLGEPKFDQSNDSDKVVQRENEKSLNNDESQMNVVVVNPKRVNRRKPGRFDDYLLYH